MSSSLWLRSLARTLGFRPASSRWRRTTLAVERLEERVVPSVGVNNQQWEDLLKGNHNPQWANGQANPKQAIYLEGDTVPYWFEGTGLDTTQTYGIRVNLNYYQQNTNAGG